MVVAALDLETVAYDSGIVNAFSCTLDVSHDFAPLVFYVDDLVVELAPLAIRKVI